MLLGEKTQNSRGTCRRMNAIFLTESCIDLNHHLALADKLRKSLDIIFLVKPATFRTVLWERGYLSFLYSELFTDDIHHSIDSWWEEQKSKGFQEISYKGYELWQYTEFERELIWRKMFAYDSLWTGEKSGKIHGKQSEKLFEMAVEPKRGLMRDEEGLSDLEDIYKHTAGLTEGFTRFLHFFKPQGVFIWNGLFLPTRICTEVAQRFGAKVSFSEEGYFPRTMIVDEHGVNARSYLCDPIRWKEIARNDLAPSEKASLKRFLGRFHAGGESRVERSEKVSEENLHARLGIPSDKKIVLYPAQIDTDTNIVLSSPNFRTNEDVIGDLARVVGDYPEYLLVVKLHPRDRNRSAEFQTVLGDQGTVVGNMNLLSLLETAEIIVVRNTTVGLEALTYYKPVIVLGDAIYSGKGFTFDVSARDTLGSVFRTVAKNAVMPDDMRQQLHKFLYHLTHRYLYFLDDDLGNNAAIEDNILAELKKVRLPASGPDVQTSKYFSALFEKQQWKKSTHIEMRELAEKTWNRLSETGDVGSALLVQSCGNSVYEAVLDDILLAFPEASVDLLAGPEFGDGPMGQCTNDKVKRFSTSQRRDLLLLLTKRHDLVILVVHSIPALSTRASLFMTLCRGRFKFVFDGQARQRLLWRTWIS